MGLPVLQSSARFRSPTTKRWESDVFETVQSDYRKPRHVVKVGMQRRAPMRVDGTIVRITRCDSGKADQWFGMRRTWEKSVMTLQPTELVNSTVAEWVGETCLEITVG